MRDTEEEKFGIDKALNSFLKWLGAFLICVVAPLTALYNSWIWAVVIATTGIIAIVLNISRVRGNGNSAASKFRELAVYLTIFSIILLYVDSITRLCGVFFLLVMAVIFLFLSFFENKYLP